MTLVDAWIQHPTPAFVRHEMFASLRRWMGLTEVPDAIPIELTIAACEAAGVTRALLSAWHGPEGALISNDEVAAQVAARPDLFVGIASVDLYRPMRAVRELRRAVNELGFKGLRCCRGCGGCRPTIDATTRSTSSASSSASPSAFRSATRVR